MAFEAIEKALRDGCEFYAFRSGGGLRVCSLKHNLLHFYGEHPDFMVALEHLNEDAIAGGREYSEIYGKLHEHYWTGSSSASSMTRSSKSKKTQCENYLQVDLIAGPLLGETGWLSTGENLNED